MAKLRSMHQYRHTPAIGAERYISSHIAAADAERVARKNGWDGDPESLLDHCDAGAAARTCTEHATLDAACGYARNALMSPSLFGAVIIEHEVFEEAHDDRGRRVEGGSWETQATYEVAMDGECIRCSDD